MAFEVFDDVAFFWFWVTLLAIVLLPWTAVWLGRIALRRMRTALCPLRHSIDDGRDCACDACEAKRLARRAALDAERGPLRRWLSWSNIAFVFLWTMFLVVLVQVPHMQTQKMATFDPYEVLELDRAAAPTLLEIKRQYRTLSLIHHPDKHPGDKEAEEQFVRISKAHQVLTDPATKENWEKYGNPDGYQGTSVTIGLPSFLTNGQNELPILIVYFICFFIVLPVTVGIWWSKAMQVHDSGVNMETIALWTQLVNPDMTLKFLVQFIGAAPEYRELESVRDSKEMSRLISKVDESGLTIKSKFNIPYMTHARELLHAHMLRLPIPSTLNPDLRLVLKESPRLLDTFIDCMAATRRLKPAFDGILLQQLICQGMWIHQDPLLQLPHVDDDIVRELNRKRVKGLQKLMRLSSESRGEILREVMGSSQKVDEVETACRSLPTVELSVATCVPGAAYDDLPEAERGIVRAGDAVQIKIKLRRVGIDELEGTEEIEVSGKERRQKLKESRKADDVAGDSTDSSSASSTGDSSASPSLFARVFCCARSHADSDSDPNSLEAIMKAAPVEKKSKGSLRQAVTPRFPFQKTERWLVALVTWRPENDEEDRKERGAVEQIVVMRRTAMTEAEDESEVTLLLPAETIGSTKYEVRVFADSYVGLDPEPIKFEINALAPLSDEQLKALRREQYYLLHPEEKKQDEERQAKRLAKSLAVKEIVKTNAPQIGDGADSDSDSGSDDDSDDSDDDVDARIARHQYEDEDEANPEEEAPIRWYYLWNTNAIEGIITVGLLWLVGFLIVDIADKRGWWDPYFQPVLDRIHRILDPFFARDTFLRNAFGAVYRFFSLGKRDNGIAPFTPPQ